jgi:hypothetical protein
VPELHRSTTAALALVAQELATRQIRLLAEL